MKAGIVAVPVFPPDPSKLRKSMLMFSSITENSGAKIALTNTAYGWAKRVAGIKSVLARSKTVWPDLKWVVTDKSVDAKGGKRDVSGFLEPKPDDIAFLQYTSGSTSAPKGVIVKGLKDFCRRDFVQALRQFKAAQLLTNDTSLNLLIKLTVYLISMTHQKTAFDWTPPSLKEHEDCNKLLSSMTEFVPLQADFNKILNELMPKEL